MACRKTKSLPSLTLCGMSGIDGNPPGASTSPKRIVGNAHLAFNLGRINCCKKSCASFSTPTLSLSLAPHSHGFRSERGCHTALREIYHNWVGTVSFIEGDISKCFDALSHELLLSILRETIKDERFMRLISGLLKAGYLEDWRWNQTYSGSPQGSLSVPSSPICIWINWTSLSKPCSFQRIREEPRGKLTKRMNNSYTEPPTCLKQGDKKRRKQ